ncbi:uncharacterized protein LOC106170532 [Lingula anatina]|uniref:Uncharacterized protein LOC106170532 n=1 Tax=Lingula anatina TaxID=7574 RepID=A0A2R2MRW1_LINAN|nr:uncharacterized protein LOC106170532 [Lingula anatina]|eukprot:XP_023932994.1 uncharacterized protein LOC106170532 [Lingula anatina]
MGIAGQLGLLLLKGLTQQLRYAVVLGVKVAWPLAIFTAVVVVRVSVPPEEKTNCNYTVYSLPNSGGLSFVQSFVCNINNTCANEETAADNTAAAGTASARLSTLFAEMEPLLNDSRTRSVLNGLPQTATLIKALATTLETPVVQEFLGKNWTVAELFRNPDEVKSYLVTQLGVLPDYVVDNILAATLNMTGLYNLTGSINFKSIVCGTDMLKKYLVFSSAVDVSAVSSSLCGIQDDLIPVIVNKLQTEIDVAEIVRIAAVFSDLYGEYTLGKGLRDVATMIDTVLQLASLQPWNSVTESDLQAASLWLKAASSVVRSLETSQTLDFTSISALLTAGSSHIQNSSWSSIGPMVNVANLMIVTFNDQLDSMKAMYNSSSMFGKLMNYTIMYGPDYIEAMAVTMLDEQKLTQLSLNADMIGLFCNYTEFVKYFSLPSYVPVSQIHTEVCTNMAALSAHMTAAMGGNWATAMAQFHTALNSTASSADLQTTLNNGKQLQSNLESFFTVQSETMAHLQKVNWTRFLEAFGKYDAAVKTLMNSYMNDSSSYNQYMYNMLSAMDARMDQNNTHWQMMKMNMFITDHVIQHMNQQLLRQQAMYSQSTAIFQLVNHTLTHGVDIIPALVTAMMDTQKVLNLTSFTDPLALICNPSMLQSILALPSSVPVTEMTSLICTNVTTIIAQITADVGTVTQWGQNLTALLNDTSAVSSFNFTHLSIHSTELQTNMMTFQQSVAADISRLMTPGSISVNWTQVTEKLGSFGAALQTMFTSMGNDLSSITTMLETLDTALMNVTSWRTLKLYMSIMNTAVTAVNADMQNALANGMRVRDLLPTADWLHDFINTTILATKDVVDHYASSMVSPDQVLLGLLQIPVLDIQADSVQTTDVTNETLSNVTESANQTLTNVTESANETITNVAESVVQMTFNICNSSVTIASLLGVTNSANLDRLHEMVCNSTIQTAMLTELMSDPALSAILQIQSVNLTEVPNVQLNWTAVQGNMNALMATFMQLMSYNGTYLTDTPITSLLVSLETLQQSMMQFNVTSYLNSLSSLYTILDDPSLANNSMLSSVLNVTQSYLGTIQSQLDLMSAQLEKINANTTSIIVLEDILTAEVRKVTALIDNLPVLVQFALEFVTTEHRNFSQFNQSQENIIMSICYNVTTFEAFFGVNTTNSEVNSTHLQSLLCEALQLNTSTLVTELTQSQSTEVANMIMSATGQATAANFTTLQNSISRYMAALAAVQSLNITIPQFSLTGNDADNFNVTMWQPLVMSYLPRLMEHVTTNMGSTCDAVISLVASQHGGTMDMSGLYINSQVTDMIHNLVVQGSGLSGLLCDYMSMNSTATMMTAMDIQTRIMNIVQVLSNSSMQTGNDTNSTSSTVSLPFSCSATLAKETEIRNYITNWINSTNITALAMSCMPQSYGDIVSGTCSSLESMLSADPGYSSMASYFAAVAPVLEEVSNQLMGSGDINDFLCDAVSGDVSASMSRAMSIQQSMQQLLSLINSTSMDVSNSNSSNSTVTPYTVSYNCSDAIALVTKLTGLANPATWALNYTRVVQCMPSFTDTSFLTDTCSSVSAMLDPATKTMFALGNQAAKMVHQQALAHLDFPGLVCDAVTMNQAGLMAKITSLNTTAMDIMAMVSAVMNGTETISFNCSEIVSLSTTLTDFINHTATNFNMSAMTSCLMASQDVSKMNTTAMLYGSCVQAASTGALPMFAYMQAYLELMTDYYGVMEEMMCYGMSMNVTALMTTVTQLQSDPVFMTKMGEMMTMNFSSPVSCDSLASNFHSVMTKMNATVHNGAAMFTKCMAPDMAHMDFGTMMKQMLVQVNGYMSSDPNMAVIWTPMYLVLQNVLSNSTWTSMTSFSSILSSNPGHLPDLAQISGASSQLIAALMNSTFNVNPTTIAAMSRDDLESVLCNVTALSQLISLHPAFQLTTANISAAICGPNKNETISTLAQMLDIQKVAMAFLETGVPSSFNSQWALSVLNTTTNLVTSLSEFTQIATLMTNFNVESLAAAAPSLVAFFNGGGAETVFTNLDLLINDFKNIVGNDSTARALLNDAQIMSAGIKGLYLLQNFFPLQVQLKQVFLNETAMEVFLTDTVNLPSTVAQEILAANLSFAEMINLGQADLNVKSIFCDPQKLGKLLILNNTVSNGVTMATVSTALCAMNENQTASITQQLLSMLEVGELVKRFVTSSVDSLIHQYNVSSEDIRSVFQTGTSIQPNLTVALSSVTNYTNGLNVFNSADGTISGAQAVQGMSEMLCGTETAFDISSSFSRESATGESPSTSSSTSSSALSSMEIPTDLPASCEALYQQIQSVDSGAIIWTYMEPLMRGKVPFYPATSEYAAIMSETNSTFESLATFVELAKSWANGVTGLQELLNISSQMTVIENALKSNSFVGGALENAFGVSVDDMMSSLNSFSSFSAEDLTKLKAMADLIVNYTECFDLDRMEGYSSEAELEDRVQALGSGSLMGAVVFRNSSSSTSSRKKRATASIPKHVKYEIRMDIDNVARTDRMRDLIWRPEPSDDFGEDMRYMRGFIQLQEMVEQAVIKAHTGKTDLPAVNLQQMPFPCYEKDDFMYYMANYLFPVIMCLSWLIVVAVSVRGAVYEREKSRMEILQIMGLRPVLSWLSWALLVFVEMLILSIMALFLLKVSGSLRHTDMGIFFLFCLDFSLASMAVSLMVAAFFTSPGLASLTAVMVFLIMYLPYVIVISMEVHITLAGTVVLCLFSNTAFAYALAIMGRYEQQGVGINWNNVIVNPYKGVDMSFTGACIMILVDAIIYLLIALFVLIAVPKIKMRLRKRNKVSDEPGNSQFMFSADSRVVEPQVNSLPVGISLTGVTKVFTENGKVAVDDLTLDFYRGQITAFLGHNGAGKTTTINMLTGIVAPSQGTIVVDGKDISKEFSKLRGHVGYCPQEDVLFSYLNVQEHLMFFGRLSEKYSKSELKNKVEEMLKDIKMEHVRKEVASNLSGGMRRRLSVAAAFIGGAETIVLDEPTAGVDPAARRAIWELILKYKEGRTILLCTHHLDEADVLSDRTAIIHKGKLLCVGSPLFLKRHFGTGHKLTISKKPGAVGDESSQKILDFVTRHLPLASLIEEVGTEMTFGLHLNQGQSGTLEKFFLVLEENPEFKNIVNGYGISETTMEEVFLQVCSNAESGRLLNTELDASVDKEETPTEQNRITRTWSMEATEKTPRATGIRLRLQQFGALIVKRFHHYRRDWKTFVLGLILPMAFLILALGLSLIKPQMADMPSIPLMPSLYDPDHVFYKIENPTPFNQRLASFLTQDIGLGTRCMPDFDEKSSYPCSNTAEPGFVTGANNSDWLPLCHCEGGKQICEGGSNTNPPHMSLNSTEILYNLDGYDVQDYLERTHFDFVEKRYGGFTFGNASSNLDVDQSITVHYNTKGYHAMPAFYNTISNLLLRANIDPLTQGDPEEYGITVYNHPYKLSKEQLSKEALINKLADLGIALMILISFSFIPASFTLYLVLERVYHEKRLQFVYGVKSLTYWAATFVWDYLVYLVVVAVAAGILAAFQIDAFSANLNLAATVSLLIMFGFACLPQMYLIQMLFKDASMVFLTLFSFNLATGFVTSLIVFMFSMFPTLTTASDVIGYVLVVLPQFALTSGLVKLLRNQLIADVYQNFGQNAYQNPFNIDFLGINFIFLAVNGLVYMILLIVLDDKVCCNTGVKEQKNHSHVKEDEDVTAERRRVASSAQNDTMTCNTISKVYRTKGLSKILAVDKVSFGVQRGECFGLLGVNGAGKTTTFKMITGDLKPSAGDIDGQALCGDVGYCPQLDPSTYLTGEEVLTCYGKLKGLQGADLNRAVETIIDILGLHEFVKRKVLTYSGGQKRSVSTGVAILGNPAMVLLDEPTAGMDPKTRRNVWKVIQETVNSGRSVLLTSHSMAECEALCSRLAIMVNGSFRCLGSPQHIKNKFGNGYTVNLRMRSDGSDVKAVRAALTSRYPGAVIKDQHYNTVVVSIPGQSTKLSDIFGFLERAKEDLGIEYYGVSQTSLDQVFVNFAKKQHDGITDEMEDEENEQGSTSGQCQDPENKFVDYNNAPPPKSHILYEQNIVQVAPDYLELAAEKAKTKPLPPLNISPGKLPLINESSLKNGLTDPVVVATDENLPPKQQTGSQISVKSKSSNETASSSGVSRKQSEVAADEVLTTKQLTESQVSVKPGSSKPASASSSTRPQSSDSAHFKQNGSQLSVQSGSSKLSRPGSGMVTTGLGSQSTLVPVESVSEQTTIPELHTSASVEKQKTEISVATARGVNPGLPTTPAPVEPLEADLTGTNL